MGLDQSLYVSEHELNPVDGTAYDYESNFRFKPEFTEILYLRNEHKFHKKLEEMFNMKDKLNCYYLRLNREHIEHLNNERWIYDQVKIEAINAIDNGYYVYYVGWY